MKYINLIVAILMRASFSLAAQALANDIVQGPAGTYTVVDIQWQVPINPGRTDTVVGTVEDVIRHLAVVAPEILGAKNILVPGPEPTDVPVPLAGPLVKTPQPTNLQCDLFQNGGKMLKFYDGIRYLYGLNDQSGKPTNGPVRLRTP
ncbi:hypothetical protein UCDDA912_g05910 [Diaporthe ampelina]|uniref:Uncharacterized protein n=1 Tax=Diaporthe ampelina TaxID=1214573 RepID=A0A0G2FI29_9PEZI|nr:hypothetical protein UCDDA912_g05910 [Diaporthe ampelina]